MSTEFAMFGIGVARCIAASVALYGAYKLAMAEKDSWGWLLFVGILLGSFSVNISGN